jgi:serine/threonine-protein kinase
MEGEQQKAIEVVCQTVKNSDVGSRPLLGLREYETKPNDRVEKSLIHCFKQLLNDTDRSIRVNAAYALWEFRWKKLELMDLLKIIWAITILDLTPRSAPKVLTIGVILSIAIVAVAGMLLFGGRSACQREMLSADNLICQTINPKATPITVEVPVEPTPIQPLEHKMVQIPAGSFIYGTGENSTEQNLDTYYIDKYEVTNVQYSLCVRAEICRAPMNSKYDSEEYLQHPVTDVSLEDAQAYCSWIGGNLPSELQWEKAARGTEGLEYPWGNEPIQDEQANICDARCTESMSVAAIDDGFERTAPVGSFPKGASPYGVEDMIGNVSEWTADGVTRGGSWQNNRLPNKPTHRIPLDPTKRDASLGFRCVKSER